VTTDGADPGELRGFDAAARLAGVRADSAARELGHDRIGTEHLLLGLLTSDSATARVLANAGVTLTAARHKVSEAVGPLGAAAGGAPAATAGALPRTPRAERALGRSVRFAHTRGSDLVGSQHVLLGVLDVEGTAGQVLRGLGLDVDRLRRTLDRLRTDGAESADADQPPGEDVPEEEAPPAPVPAEVACGSCGADLADHLVFRVLKARNDQGRTRDVLVFSCARCGRALGLR
jgi:ATP-dependent Clp protease ATP-binding subunit ClpA